MRNSDLCVVIKNKRECMKRIFVIDWVLVAAFAMTAVSGFGMHVAGHGDSHELWHGWAVFHVLASALFCIVMIFHVATHREWYRGLVRNGVGRKSKVTVVLTILSVCLSFSGIFLFGVDGANSQPGLFHYAVGIVTALTACVHVAKRLPVLLRSLRG